MIDWGMPIEWTDGTAAWLDNSALNEPEDGAAPRYYLVVSTREPAGWNRRMMPKLDATSPVMVLPDGRLETNGNAPGAPRIRNVAMPLLRFQDGTAPVGGTLSHAGDTVSLTHVDGTKHLYRWPTLRPAVGGVAPLVLITQADIEREVKAEAEAAEMEENPLFGMF